jgi:hypothetical protein
MVLITISPAVYVLRSDFIRYLVALADHVERSSNINKMYSVVRTLLGNVNSRLYTSVLGM